MRPAFHTFLALASLLLILSSTAFAAEPKLARGAIAELKDRSLGKVACTNVDGVLVAGKKKRKKFTPTASQMPKLLVSLQKAVAKGKTRSITKAQAKVAALQAKIDAQQALCTSHFGATEPNPQPTPPPPPDPVADDALSLAPVAGPVSREQVRFLTEKAGYGFGPEHEPLIGLGADSGIDAVVNEFMRTRPEPEGLLASLEQRMFDSSNPSPPRTRQRQAILDLWLHTANPYSEKLAFFLLSVWTVAGDFTTPANVNSSFWDYYKRLRSYAAVDTDIPSLAIEITRDPLMLRYLDNAENVRQKPNENYARELLELFTMGPRDLDGNANYTETAPDGSGDIAAAARMLTGWVPRLDATTGIASSQFIPHRHAPGPHVMFQGAPHQFTGENESDLIAGIFRHHPSVKTYYAQEILKEYLTPQPPRALVESFGQVIADNQFRLRPAMAVLLKSRAFYHSNYRDTVPKNSAEYLVETLRLLDMQDHLDIARLEHILHLGGMDVNDSPTVFWYAPSTWTGPSVLLERANSIAAFVATDGGSSVNLEMLFPTGSLGAGATIDWIAERIGAAPLPADLRSNLETYMSTRVTPAGETLQIPYDNENRDHRRSKGMGVYSVLMSTPAYQLK